MSMRGNAAPFHSLYDTVERPERGNGDGLQSSRLAPEYSTSVRSRPLRRVRPLNDTDSENSERSDSCSESSGSAAGTRTIRGMRGIVQNAGGREIEAPTIQGVPRLASRQSWQDRRLHGFASDNTVDIDYSDIEAGQTAYANAGYDGSSDFPHSDIDGTSQEFSDVDQEFHPEDFDETASEAALSEPKALPVLPKLAALSEEQLKNLWPLGIESSEVFMCPITNGAMQDPVVCADGYTYERSAISTWLEKSRMSPVTGQQLKNTALFPNQSVRLLLQLMIDMRDCKSV